MVSKIKKIIISHDLSHDLKIQKKYSEPVIYTAKGDLNKVWYVYFSYRNPLNQKMQRMDNIYVSINFDKKDRLTLLKQIKTNLYDMLKKGFNPYDIDNLIEDEKKYTIAEAFEYALKLKKEVLGTISYSNFKSRIKKFESWLNNNGFEKRYISTINKRTVTTYLNEILIKTSARNRNNTRTDILGIFQVLENNEIISSNFVKSIDILNSKPEKNKSYSSTQELAIFTYMEEHDPLMLLFVKFISYNFLRPVEVCRLRIEDIDLIDKNIRLKTKTGYKIKLLPQILIDDLPDLSKFKKNSFLFGRTEIGQEWDATENNRRDHFSKQFKIIKDKFKLGADYGLYSFRHTFIGKLYNVFIKEMTPDETEGKLMLITGHDTRKALQQYLREIHAYKPEDYSKHLKPEFLPNKISL